jgi:uncharacterized membrane protein HdeD (DUF308 family)
VDFQEADGRYAEIKRRHEAGDLIQEEFDEQLKQLMVQDEEGRWWAKSRTTGEWHYHDGTAWVKDTPPGYQAAQAAPEDQPEIQQSESLEAQEVARRVAAIYAEGQRHMDAEEWQQALEFLEEVQRREPGYRETETLLSQVHRQLASPPMVEVADLSGQDTHQANATLANMGLKVRVQSEVPSDTTPTGQVIEQSPEAGREVGAGSSVNITVSSGPQRQPLLPALAGSWWALALRGLVLAIFGLTELISIFLVLDFRFFQFAALLMIADGVFAIIDAASSRYRRRPLLVQGIISGVVGLLTSSIATLPTNYFPSYNPAFAAVGSWAVFIGMIRIIATIQRWREIKTLWLMGMSGVLLVVFGILMAAPYGFPRWFLGSWSLASGLTLVTFAFGARNREERDSRVT